MEKTTIGKVNLQILPEIKTGLLSLETELVLPGNQFLTTVKNFGIYLYCIHTKKLNLLKMV